MMVNQEVVDDIKKAQALLENVVNCYEDPENEEINEHYDCGSDLKDAIQLLKGDSFEITSVSREDLIEKSTRDVNEYTDSEMDQLAHYIENAIMNEGSFWLAIEEWLEERGEFKEEE